MYSSARSSCGSTPLRILGLDLGGLKHLDMGDDAYAPRVSLPRASFITAVEPYTLTTEFSQAPLYANFVIPVERPGTAERAFAHDTAVRSTDTAMHVISDMLTEWRLASTTMGASTLRGFSAGETMHGTHGP